MQVNVGVQGKMRWIHKPEPVTKGENETVTFRCQGEGVPKPDLPTWYINGQEFTGKTFSQPCVLFYPTGRKSSLEFKFRYFAIGSTGYYYLLQILQ